MERLAAALVATWLLLPAAVSAQRASVAITYEAPPVCPDAASFSSRVAALLGFVPTTPEADDLASIQITREGDELVGTLSLVRGGESTSRSTRAGASECDGIVDALAWLLALALDPDALSAEGDVSGAPSDAQAPAEASDAHVEAQSSLFSRPAPMVPPAPAAGEPPHPFFQIAGGVDLFSLPGTWTGLGAIALGVVFDRTFELRLDLTWSSVGAEDTARGRVAATAFDARLGPCIVHEEIIGACAVLSVGAVPTWEEREGAAVSVAARVGLSIRAIARWEWTEDLGVALEVEGGVALLRPEVALQDVVAWTASPGFLTVSIPFFVRMR